MLVCTAVPFGLWWFSREWDRDVQGGPTRGLEGLPVLLGAGTAALLGALLVVGGLVAWVLGLIPEDDVQP